MVYIIPFTKTGISIRIGKLLLTNKISEEAKSLGHHSTNSRRTLMSAIVKCITAGRSLVSLSANQPDCTSGSDQKRIQANATDALASVKHLPQLFVSASSKYLKKPGLH